MIMFFPSFRYDSFHVSDEKDNYTLTIGTFTGRTAAGMGIYGFQLLNF